MELGFSASFASLLLAVLLFPELPHSQDADHLATEPATVAQQLPAEQKHPRSPRQGNYHNIVPRTPPFYDPGDYFKVVDCRRTGGVCQEFCYYMETQMGYCSEKKDSCCVRHQ
ncbi:sperm-associated antigen 11B-like [Ochotona princeps]|uniref:sperm-associated antigen 11B-like n=1 Tax=Ochotona princeps TaxID=9978 RepID=UPI002714B2CB|nr:sperm-associated antigen 11B-like [Ochotona princeps]